MSPVLLVYDGDFRLFYDLPGDTPVPAGYWVSHDFAYFMFAAGVATIERQEQVR